MRLVLDCSVALAWVMPDEASSRGAALFEQVAAHGAIVPAIWRLEVANSLLMAERRGRIGAAFRLAALQDLAVLPIAEDGATGAQAWGMTSSLAAQYRLTAYDAAYLELALRLGLGLASLDRDLAAAARSAGVALA